MNVRISATLLLLSGIALSVLAAPSPVRATLVIPDTTLLPGVPFEMWIELYNDSEHTVAVGTASRASIEPEGVGRFVIDPIITGKGYPTLLTGMNGEGLPYVEMAPHEKRILTLPVDRSLVASAFAADIRISSPGRYRISLVLDEFPGIAAPPTFTGAVTTNEVLIERVRPSGVDALVWQRLQMATDGAWAPKDWTTWVSARVRHEIVTDYRESSYYPYAALVTSSQNSDGVTQLLDAINRFPKSPVVDLLYTAAWHRPTGFAGPLTGQYEKVTTYLKAAKRPTTRFMLFGRDDVPKPPCPPDYDCQ